ncbi:RNA polymerase sigma factor [Namhaeicola litoreus]|uniref:RNA polymerase sigma factor n=1 Tax=Namhaeicola litoreus TaxID=1052145 RepID=A0ABW3Y696_9FLAO
MSEAAEINLLVEKCKKNDRRSQLQLYDQYCSAMYHIAARYLPEGAAAQDAMQDGFIKAFTHIESFNNQASFGAWLKRIIVNTCLDVLKAKKIDEIPIENVSLTLIDQDDWQVPDETTYKKVIRAIDELPQSYKHVVKLYLLEGYDHSEISEILMISEVNSRTKLARGKEKLLKLLKEN